MKLKIKNIIFDLGGVVLDIDPMEIKNQLHEIDFQNFDKLEGVEYTTLTKQFELGIITAESFRKTAKKVLGLDKIKGSTFDDIWNSMLFDIPRERIEALEEIKKHYHIYLMSNSNEIHYDMYVRDLQLRFGYNQFDDLFHKSFFSFDLHMAKPDPNIFLYALDHYGMNAEETLFFDDSIENINIAKSLGLKTYLIKKGELVRTLFHKGKLKEDIIIE